MTSELTHIPVKTLTARLAVAFVMIASAAAAVIGFRWQIGDMLGEVTGPSEPMAADIGEAAIGLAPANPRGYWLVGTAKRLSFAQDDIEAAVRFSEDAARLSPYYYRSWTELGRSNEQAGRFDEAESAFKRAVELAPEYAIPRWQLGNFYLRLGRGDEAAAEFKEAAEHKSRYRLQVFQTAWSVLGSQPSVVEPFANSSPDAQADLALFYSLHNRADDAVRVWRSIDPDDRRKFDQLAERVARELYHKASFNGSLEFARDAGVTPEARLEAVTNAGFDTPISEAKPLFDWITERSDSRVNISMDSGTKRSGTYSVKLTYRAYTKPNLNHIRQVVTVRPSTRYRLSFWVRTDDLKSGSMPVIQVLNPDNSPNAMSPAFSSGTTDWQQMSVEFLTGESGDAIFLQTSREPCTGECPISGAFWLDDLELIRL